MRSIMLGNEAIARGAYEAGTRVVSSYPGTPSTEITENTARFVEIHSEWAPNEKVALEVAIGASFAGGRAMSAMKHVGLNVAADPLFTVSYTGVNAGLVVVVADDPGMHSSQNEQDSRRYAVASKVPMLEPSDSGECLDFVKRAYEISERFDTPVLLRLTTRVAHSRSTVETGERVDAPLRDFVRNPGKYVMMPSNARPRRVVVEERTRHLEEFSSNEAEKLGIHRWVRKGTALGVLTSGITFPFVLDALPDASVLKLGMVWPFPLDLIRRFAASVDRLVVVEELDPVLEEAVRAAGIPVEGKGHFSPIGEYSTGMIRRALGSGPEPSPAFHAEDLPAAPVRPPVLCAGCPHKGLFMALARLKVVVSGDIGCYTLGALPPTKAMDTCVCMGASIGMAHGMEMAAGRPFASRTVAVIGDSTFLHSGMTGLLNTVYNHGTTTTVILDNSITGMTGHQQNPSTGRDLLGNPSPSVDFEALCRALGVKRIRVVDPNDTFETEKVLKEELAAEEPSVVITRRPCVLLPGVRGKGRYRVDPSVCTRCRACLKAMCPAMSGGTDAPVSIDPDACTGCDLCARLCKFGAIVKEEAT